MTLVAAIALAAASGAAAAPRIPIALQLLPPLVPPGERFAPAALAVDPLGALMVLDRAHGEIYRWSDGKGWTQFGSGGQGGPRVAHLISLDVGPGTELLALDPTGPTLHRFDLDGHFAGTLELGPSLEAADVGAADVDPVDFTLGRSGELYLLDRAGGRLFLFDRDGRLVTDLFSTAVGEARPRSPTRVACDRSGNVLVLDNGRNRVHRVTRQGALLPPIDCGEGLRGGAAAAGALATFPAGGLAVSAQDGSWVRIFDDDGELVFHGEIGALAGSEVQDLVAYGGDSLVLGRSGSSSLQRVQVRYRDAPADGLR